MTHTHNDKTNEIHTETYKHTQRDPHNVTLTHNVTHNHTITNIQIMTLTHKHTKLNKKSTNVLRYCVPAHCFSVDCVGEFVYFFTIFIE